MNSSIMFSHMGNLANLSDTQTRSITPENPDGAKAGGARLEPKDGTAYESSKDLGRGWKVNPFIHIKRDEVITIAEIDGPGNIQHIWLTPTGHWRHAIIRIYWDHQEHPSVECPIGDFFANGWQDYAQVNSLAINVNPGSGLNSFWPMPFQKHCRITIENVGWEDIRLYYQVTYALGKLSQDIAYFHAYFNRSNPVLKGDVHHILPQMQGQGHFVGTYICWQVNHDGWWGEGEVKFYLDGDEEFPTICGTGLEDYFLGSYNFDATFCSRTLRGYQAYTGPYTGMPQVIRPDGEYKSNQRFGMYRWHIADPIRFQKDVKATVQSLGWRRGENEQQLRYAQLQDDVSSVAFWYQTLPGQVLPKLQHRDELEIIESSI
ncbi:glycoside hydrolase family 172 protein [Poriferisphaera sp. WC338]|uniref:glycoside hydrolase family 172 protein n=1 Tax=Poriferisphaera sp. WC338 TaxID=3425129 RepID=UPI003D8181FF